jgi:hypothetical protein
VRQTVEGPTPFSYVRFIIKVVICALIIEAFSLPPAVLTMGHAGPEGPFASIGWLGLAINLIGFAIAGRFAPYDSVLRFSFCVLAIQVCFITCVAMILKWVVERMQTK